MNQRPPHSLDAEERALARALPRLHGRTTPGPDIDASILAAAQAAVQPARPARHPTRPRVRWIAPTSLAASLILAAGLAWHLRPLPAPESSQSTARSDEAGESGVAMIEAPPPARSAPVVESKPAPASDRSIAPARKQASPPAAVAQDALQAPADKAVQMLPPPPTPPPASASASASAAAAAQVPQPPAAPASTMEMQAGERVMRQRTNAPAAGTSSGAVSRDAVPAMAGKAMAEKTETADRSRPAEPGAKRPAPVAPETRNEAELAADAGFVDDPGEDIPPATAASPAVRDAWLHRIGELLEQGRRQEARASLAEFRRRYPSMVLPPALQALESEP
jgi:hypothetical protein